MKKKYSQALKRKKKRKKGKRRRRNPQIYAISSNIAYSIVIGKTKSIIGEILLGVTFENGRATGIYERPTHFNPEFSLGCFPDEDWANQWKKQLLKESRKCRGEIYTIASKSFDISSRNVDQPLLNSLVGRPVKFNTQQSVTAEEFAMAVEEFHAEWRPFDWEDWGK